VSIIGRNGVGKTTALELIMGRARQRAGTIRLNGQAIDALPVFLRSRAGLGFVPQSREIFPNLTVMENLGAAVRPGDWGLARVLELFPSLQRRTKNLGKQLSGGELQMLAIARALVGNPQVLLMDEPTEGLAPIVVEQVVAAIKALTSARALAIVLIEQIIDVAFDLSDRSIVMDRGHIVHEAPSAVLRKDRKFVQAMMGLHVGRE
jgi:branched-chain amino acid transport system ATP-binding protein